MLAHELRNPLAPISAAADLLRLAKFDKARVRQTGEIITSQVRAMLIKSTVAQVWALIRS